MSKDTLKTADSFDDELLKIVKTHGDGLTIKGATYMSDDEALQAIKLAFDKHVIDTEWKDVYSKADTTEKAIPQLKANYKSQLRQALFNGEGEKK